MSNSQFPGEYSPLHCRSRFSFLRGVLSPDDMCRHARDQGAPAVGLCDVNGFYGVPEFVRRAGEYGIKPVIGTEIHFEGRFLFTLYVLNRSGFARINEIITRILEYQRREKGGSASAHIPLSAGYHPVDDLLAEGWQGVVIASVSPDLLTRLAARTRQGLYVMLQWGLPFAALAREAARRNLPLLAVNRGLYLDDSQRELYRLLRAIDGNVTLERAPSLPPSSSRLCSAAEYSNYFSAVPEAVLHARRLVRDACFGFTPERFVFPSFRGMNADREFLYLSSLCRQGIRRRYEAETPEIRTRLSSELSIIRRKGFAGYFLVVHDIVGQCSRTCGRGSSAASIVSYLLGITHVDPLAHNLFFERFLNMGRKDPPDIDVDFPWDERRRILDYVFDTYAGRSGMVADHITFGPRSGIRDPARAFGYEEHEISAMEEELRLGKKELPPFLRDARSLLRGHPRNLGTHPGGVVITPGPISRYAHIQLSPLGIPVIPWEKDGAEEAGLVKIDLLGNRSLAVLRDSLSLVNDKCESRGQERIEWERFAPLDDAGTRAMIERGDTMGVFYIESPATRQLLRKMGRGDYPHLVVASSIIRPAANRYIREYVRRLHGGVYDSLHPSLERVLAETFGIMVYQEDVARVAIAVCGLSPEEADALRKILSKKDKGVRLDVLKERFFEGARAKGVNDSVTTVLWDCILSFEGYSFCKAHSASYALVSYRLAWLKRWHPLEFMVSVINNGGGFYSRQAYISFCRRLGFPVRLPDINKSLIACSPEDGGIRLGLGQLKGMGDGFSGRIVTEREARGSFEDIGDFLDRMSPRLEEMETLVRSGTLDSLCPGYNRPQIFWLYFSHTRGRSLFGLPSPPDICDYPAASRILHEIQTLDMLVSVHPLSVLQAEIDLQCRIGNFVLTSSRFLDGLRGQRAVLAGMKVTGKEVLTRKRQEMCFATFEDTEGLFETVIFPDRYACLLPVLERHVCFLVRGKVTGDFGVCVLEIDDIIPLCASAGRENGIVQYRAEKDGLSAYPENGGFPACHMSG